ncbi:MAG: GtrA family protein [Rubrivivax sp.]|nr:GtrA family protein [Rubrivivax sp.]
MLKVFARFAGAGAVGTLAQYVVLVFLVGGLGVHPGVGAATGATLGACINYALAHGYVFHSDQRHVVAFPRFALMAATGVGLNGAIVGWLAGVGWRYLLAQVAATAVVLVFNFAVSSLWIFRPSSRSPRPPASSRSS